MSNRVARKGAKAQSAVEYFMNYIWLVMILTVVLAFLIYSGVLNPDFLAPSACLFSPGMLCSNFTLSNNGVLTVGIKQLLSAPINVIAVGCGTDIATAHMSPPQVAGGSIVVPNGGNYLFDVQCYSDGTAFTGKIGQAFRGYLFINYIPEGGAQHTVQARLIVKVSHMLGTSTTIATTSIPQGYAQFNDIGWIASNDPVQYGQYQALNSVVSGGVPPYTYTFLVYNAEGSLVDTLVRSGISSTSNTYAFQENPAWGYGLFMANAVVTDSESTPASVANTMTYTVETTTTSILLYPAFYCVGGYDNDAGQETDAVYYAATDSGGELMGWIPASSYPANVDYHSCTSSGNTIYCVGGDDQFGSTLDSVYYAPVNSAGDPGSWTAADPYPFEVAELGCASTANAVYCVGGYDQSSDEYTGAVYYAGVLPDNSLGTWTAAISYPTAIEDSSCYVAQDGLYCVGGWDNTDGYITAAAYYAAIGPDSSLGTWTATTSYPIAFEHGSCAATQDDAYCVGGYNDDLGNVGYAYYSPVLSGGGLGAWTATSEYPEDVAEHSCVSTSSALYCIAGYDSISGSANAVYRASILSGGALGAWTSGTDYPLNDTDLSCVLSATTSPTTLTTTSTTSTSITVVPALYCVGGLPANTYIDTNAVYYAAIGSGGSLMNWVRTSDYPAYISMHSCASSGSTLYCVGGFNSSADEYLDAVYYAPVSQVSYLVTWTATNSYPSIVGGTSCVATQSDVYCIGGFASYSYTDAVYYAEILPNGGLGTWTSTSSYPTTVGDASCIAGSDGIYCVDGRTSSYADYTDAVYYAPILADNSLGAWAATTSYPLALDAPSCATTQNGIYCAAGHSADFGNTNTAYYASIVSGGDLGTWTSGPDYPENVIDHSCAGAQGSVYCVGGYDDISGYDTNSAYRSQTSGGMGAWSAGHDYPLSVSELSCAVSATSEPTTSTVTTTSTTSTTSTSITFSTALYCIGGDIINYDVYGNPSSAMPITYYAPIVPGSNALSAWAQGSPYPLNIEYGDCISASNAIYCVGGYDSAADAYTSSVYYAPTLTNNVLGAWTSTTRYPYSLENEQCVATSSDVYCLGGWTNSFVLVNTVYYAPVLPGGGLGTWTFSGTCNACSASCVASPTAIYCLGGFYASYSVIQPDGSLGAWHGTFSYYSMTGYYNNVCTATAHAVYCMSPANYYWQQSPAYYAPIFSDFSMGPWSPVSAYPVGLGSGRCAASPNAIYCVGGGENSFSVYYSQIQSSYQLGPWNSAANYPVGIENHVCALVPTTSTTSITTTSVSTTTATTTSVTFPPRLYCVGGWTGRYNVASVYAANIMSNNALGTWFSSIGYPVSGGITSPSCVPTANAVYCVGGQANGEGYGMSINSVYYATLLGNSTLSTWTRTTDFPMKMAGISCVSGSGYVYCIGSEYGVNSLTYYAPMMSDNSLGAWSTTTSYPAGIDGQQCSASGGYVYCVAGMNGMYYYFNAVYSAPILGASGLGAWSYQGKYPINSLIEHACTASNGYMYCLGGYDVYSWYTNAVYYAPISGGTVGAWTSATRYPEQGSDTMSMSCDAAYNALYCVGGYPYDWSVYYASVLSGGSLGTWVSGSQYPGGSLTQLSCFNLPTTTTTMSTTSVTITTIAYGMRYYSVVNSLGNRVSSAMSVYQEGAGYNQWCQASDSYGGLSPANWTSSWDNAYSAVDGSGVPFGIRMCDTTGSVYDIALEEMNVYISQPYFGHTWQGYSAEGGSTSSPQSSYTYSYNAVYGSAGTPVAVALEVSCGDHACSSVSLPANCAQVDQTVSDSGYESVYIARCNQRSGDPTYSVVATPDSPGYVSIGVLQFPYGWWDDANIIRETTTTSISTTSVSSTSTTPTSTTICSYPVNAYAGMSLTLPSGYPQYVCAAASMPWQSTPTTWTDEVGTAYTHTGRTTSNVCTVDMGNCGSGCVAQNVAGIAQCSSDGPDVLLSQTISTNTFWTSGSFTPSTSSSTLIISVTCGHWKRCTGITLPSGCSRVVDMCETNDNYCYYNGREGDGTIVMGICQSLPQTPYTISGREYDTLGAPSDVAIEVYEWS